MNGFIEWLNHNPLLNLVFLILAILSIVISVILYIKSKRKKRPCFHMKTFKLIEDSIKEIEAVEILYQGQTVKNLSLSKVALWNSGSDTINSEDIAPKDPLKLVITKGTKLLAAQIIYSTNSINNFSLTPDLQSGEIGISFDYFDRNEGIVIQIYHTGVSNDNVILSGTVKGVSRVVKASTEEDYYLHLVTAPIDSALNRIKSRMARVIVIVFLIPIFIALAIPLMFLDKVTLPMRRIPRQFNI